MNPKTANLVEDFVKVALEEIDNLKTSLTQLKYKEAELAEKEERELHEALKLAAQALYDSDFISDEYDKKKFVKKAKEDVKYLSTVIQKICQASDVSTFGEVASVKTAGDNSDDPVMRKAFGYDVNYNLLDD
jgi:hypothetical protein